MKILVTTPAGRIGRRIVDELLAPEFSVRVISRDPARLPDEVLKQAEVVCGSLDDAAVLREALDGVEALFWCAPPEPRQSTDVRGHYERFARAAGQAIRAAGTPRVVAVSAGGKGLARSAGRLSGLHVMEDILNESGAAIRHLRCAPFMENLLGQAQRMAGQGTLSYPMPGHVALPLVAVRDVADAALRWLVRRDWSGVKGVAVHGPEDLTYNEVAETIGWVLDRPVQYQEASANQYAKALIEHGASAEFARRRVEMFGELAQGILRAESRTRESTTPTTLLTWAEHELLPAVEAMRGEHCTCACAI
ncbi:MAG: NAD(P)H-binding protein [Verrucomicrobiota bacterium]